MRTHKRYARITASLFAAALIFGSPVRAATQDPCRAVYTAGYSSEIYVVPWGNRFRKSEAEALARTACYEDRVTVGDLRTERDLYIAQCLSRGENCMPLLSYSFDINCEAASCSGSGRNGWTCHYDNMVELTVRCMNFDQYLREISEGSEAASST